MSPQLTVVDAVACAAPSLLVDTFAVLGIAAQLSLVVALVMWTCLDWFVVSVPKLHVRTPPEIEQPLLEFAPSIDQLTPVLIGSVSVTVTVRASPAPVFVAVMTNPIVSPAETVAAS